MKYPLILLIALSATINSFSQRLTPKEIEKDLLISSSKLFSLYQSDSYDSLEKQRELFTNKMINYISQYPSTLSYSFKSLIDSNACDIATSADGLFRIYSWDTWMGGTMHFFKNIYQFKSGGKVYSKPFDLEEDDASGFYSEIFTLKANNKTYYLGISNAIFSTKDAAKSIKVFTIENNSLNDTVKLFRTKKELLNEINFEFDFFSVMERPERPVKLIKYDPVKKIVYIPVVDEDNQVTDRFILYQFKGKYFEHILTQKKSTEEASLQTVKRIFNSYTAYAESTDSKENKETMTAALQSLQKSFFKKDMDLLINVWMYYDPTDFAVRPLIEPIFKNNRLTALKAIEQRLQNKKEWEDENNAPFSELRSLKEKVLK